MNDIVRECCVCGCTICDGEAYWYDGESFYCLDHGEVA